MRGLILIVGLFISLTGFSQERDTFQADSLYRVNNVKTKIRFNENTQSKSKLIYNYDKLGRWIEFILTDNFIEDKVQMKVEYQYDDNGKLIKETETSYSGDKAQITDSKIEYDEKGRVVKKQRAINGQVVSEKTYKYQPLVELEKQYRDGKIYREQTSYYVYPNYSIRFTGTEWADKNAQPRKIEMPDGKVIKIDPPKEDRKWDYKFENKVDEQGRLVERKRFNGLVQDEITYKYNDKGLLIEKLDRMITSKIEVREFFEYEYWP